MMNSMPESSPVLTRVYRTWCEGCGEGGETSNIDRSGGLCVSCRDNRVVELLFLEPESSNRHLNLIMEMRREFEFGFERLENVAKIAREIRLYVKNFGCDSVKP